MSDSRVRLLSAVCAFSSLSADAVSKLASNLTEIVHNTGDIIIHQGDRGDTCFVIVAGSVEVLRRNDDGEETQVGIISSGQIFGEMALLADIPRTATVRALERCELLVLRRPDLLAAMGVDRQVVSQMVELLRLRERPRRVDGVVAEEGVGDDGSPVTTLKDGRRGAYFRLSQHGRFVWDCLDGNRNLRDLSIMYFVEFRSFAPYVVAEIIAGLAAAGFIAGNTLRSDVATIAGRIPLWRNILLCLRRVLECRFMLRHVDDFFARWYSRGVSIFFSRPALVIFSLISVAGIAVFVRESFAVAGAMDILAAQPALLFALIPAFVLAVVVHELGHAFTLKRFGREVLGIGIGWYWFSPIAFVDTSDMWLAGRRQRIAVNLAGLCANMVLAGLAMSVSFLIGNDRFSLLSWLFAFDSYVMVMFNLNPLMEYDGYYVLMDWLDRPNLRERSLKWMAREFPRIFSGPSVIRGHVVEFLYGTGAVLYLALMAFFALSFLRRFL